MKKGTGAPKRHQVVLRLESSINQKVRNLAKKAGKSINQYCEDVLGRQRS